MPKKAQTTDKDNNGRELMLSCDRDGFFSVVIAGTRVELAKGLIQKLDHGVGRIEDIVVPNQENVGIGSRLLCFMESWAKKNGITKLVGWLSAKDVDHIEKLRHFYSSRGYSVVMCEDWETKVKNREVKIGEISKDLV